MVGNAASKRGNGARSHWALQPLLMMLVCSVFLSTISVLPQATDRNEEGKGPAEGKSGTDLQRITGCNCPSPWQLVLSSEGDAGVHLLWYPLHLSCLYLPPYTPGGAPASPCTLLVCTGRSGREPRGPAPFRQMGL